MQSTTGQADKPVTLNGLACGYYEYVAEGDPKSGVGVGPGSVLVVDAPPVDGWLLDRVGGGFTLLAFGAVAAMDGVTIADVPAESVAARRYGASPAATC